MTASGVASPEAHWILAAMDASGHYGHIRREGW